MQQTAVPSRPERESDHPNEHQKPQRHRNPQEKTAFPEEAEKKEGDFEADDHPQGNAAMSQRPSHPGKRVYASAARQVLIRNTYAGPADGS
jgi:hypothetical protein